MFGVIYIKKILTSNIRVRATIKYLHKKQGVFKKEEGLACFVFY